MSAILWGSGSNPSPETGTRRAVYELPGKLSKNTDSPLHPLGVQFHQSGEGTQQSVFWTGAPGVGDGEPRSGQAFHSAERLRRKTLGPRSPKLFQVPSRPAPWALGLWVFVSVCTALTHPLCGREPWRQPPPWLKPPVP